MAVRFDALLRVDGESRLGAFHYLPVLFHEAEKPTLGLRVGGFGYSTARSTPSGGLCEPAVTGRWVGGSGASCAHHDVHAARW